MVVSNMSVRNNSRASSTLFIICRPYLSSFPSQSTRHHLLAFPMLLAVFLALLCIHEPATRQYQQEEEQQYRGH